MRFLCVCLQTKKNSSGFWLFFSGFRLLRTAPGDPKISKNQQILLSVGVPGATPKSGHLKAFHVSGGVLGRAWETRGTWGGTGRHGI